MTNDTSRAQDALWLSHLSCVRWSDAEEWLRYLGDAQDILESNITHLDKNDPVRRRVKLGDLKDAARYISTIGEREDSRWVFGRVDTLGIDFSVRHYRDVRAWPNTLTWYFPAEFTESDSQLKLLRNLFALGNSVLAPFYAYADMQSQISKRRCHSGAINIQAELVGVFWMTYFNAKYVECIGRNRFSTLPVMHTSMGSGITLNLGDAPTSVPGGMRDNAEMILGKKLFADPNDLIAKFPGQYAMTFDQLRS